MDFSNFLDRLDESSAKVLKEWAGQGAIDSWSSVPAEVKSALTSVGVSKAEWAYMPAGRDLIILEEGPNAWAVYSLKKTLGESKRRPSKMLNEAPGASGFEIGSMDDDEDIGDRMAATAAGSGPSAGVGATLVQKGDFASVLKECVSIVKEDAYKER